MSETAYEEFVDYVEEAIRYIVDEDDLAVDRIIIDPDMYARLLKDDSFAKNNGEILGVAIDMTTGIKRDALIVVDELEETPTPVNDRAYVPLLSFVEYRRREDEMLEEADGE